MTIQILVPSIGCAACIESITKAIQSEDPAAIVTGESATKSISVTTELTEPRVRELIAIAGHEVN